MYDARAFSVAGQRVMVNDEQRENNLKDVRAFTDRLWN
jgi:hypothetical protein